MQTSFYPSPNTVYDTPCQILCSVNLAGNSYTVQKSKLPTMTTYLTTVKVVYNFN